ncbi:MAG TPA: hypothetical protein VF173_07845 [Thermoanaerobaculia bacterium]|nr:hypothetical protein [Thermoanaerobaculia bacterium]
MKASTWMAVSLISLLAGCREAPHAMEPLVLPPTAQVAEVSVTRWKPNGDSDGSFKIFDRKKVEEILTQLRANNTGYSSAMKGLPPQEYSIAVDTEDVMAAMVWVGPGWLGGVDDHHKDEKGRLLSHYRKLDPEQHSKLLSLLKPETE